MLSTPILLLGLLLAVPASPDQSQEAVWEEVKAVMADPLLDYDAKKKKLEDFMIKFPIDDPHRQQVRWWIDQLAVEKEVNVLKPQELRTKTEYFSFQMLGGGYYGFTVGIALITIRWERFYWELVQVRGSLGNGAAMSEATIFGYHMHLGPRARHEFRFGIGPAFGLFFQGDNKDEFKGLALVPQASYLYHLSKHFAFEAVLSVIVAVVGDLQGGYPIPSPALSVGMRF